jgi:hypothetical protein
MYATSLPFDPTRPTQPVMQIDIYRPPFVPDYQCEEWLMPHRPYIAGVLMAEIQGGALRQPPAPLRIFAFNLFAVNGWRNEEFAGMFGKACDYIAFTMTVERGKFMRVEEAVPNLMPTYVTLVVAENAQIFQGLFGYLDQEAAQHVQVGIANMVSLRDKLARFRSSNPVWGYGQQQQQMMQRPYMQPNQPMMDPREMYRQSMQGQLGMVAGGGVATIPQPGIDPRLMPSSYQSTPSSSENMYTRMLAEEREQQGVPAQQAQPSVTDLLAPPFNPRTPKEQPTMQTQPDQLTSGQMLDDGSKLYSEEDGMQFWLPSEVQPYRPVYHPSTQFRLVRVMPDGAAFIEVHDKANMEFSQHNLPNELTSTFGKKRDGVQYDVSRASSAFAKGAQELAERMKWSIQSTQLGDTDEGRQAKERAEEPTAIVVTHDAWYNETSEVMAMVYTGVARAEKAATMQEAPDVFRCFSYISEPVICDKDQSDLLRRFSDSRTWLELAGKVEEALKDGDVGLVETVSRRAIITLNRVLALSLSIPPDTLSLANDGFDVATIQELEDYLAQNYSPIFINAYKKQQRNYIDSMFQTIAPKEAEDELRRNIIDPVKFPEGKAPYLALLTSCMSFTTLDIYAHDLDLELDADTGSLLTEENSGDVYRVIAELFNSLPKEHTFNKHLFQTNDGVLLEVVKGDLADGAYMLSRVHQIWFG